MEIENEKDNISNKSNTSSDSDYIDYNEDKEISKEQKSNSEKNENNDDNQEIDSNSEIEIGFNRANNDYERENEEDDEFISDRDYQTRSLLAELLFNVQKIGKYDDKEGKYRKDEFCELSLRDIHRILRRDDPENPIMKVHILKWKIIESDIVPLILAYKDVEKIQEYCLVLIIDLTEELKEICENRDAITNQLGYLQSYLVKSGLIEHVSDLLAISTERINLSYELKKEIYNERKKLKDRIEELKIKKSSLDGSNQDNKEIVEEEEKINNDENELNNRISIILQNEEKYNDIVELVFLLIKQILNIYNYNTIHSNISNVFILMDKMSKNQIYEAIIHYSKDISTKFSKKICLTIMEILYCLIRPLSPSMFFTEDGIFNMNVNGKIGDSTNMSNTNSLNSGLSLLRKLTEEENLEKQFRFANYSSRPSFFSKFEVKRSVHDSNKSIKDRVNESSSSFIVSNINKSHIEKKINYVKNQKSRPIKRFTRKKNQILVSNKVSEEIKFINDMMIFENTYIELIDNKTKESFRIFLNNFIEKCFNQFVRYLEKEVCVKFEGDGIENEEKYDYYNLINVLSFLLEFFRLTQYKNQDIQRKRFNNKSIEIPFIYKNIINIFSSRLMSLVYFIANRNALLSKHSSFSSSKLRSTYDLFASIKFLKVMLLISIDSFNSSSDVNLEISISIQDELLNKDYRKIFKTAFFSYRECYYSKHLLYSLIETTDIYFNCMEMFSQKRNLTIQTKKLRRKPLVKRGKEEEEGYLDVSNDEYESYDEEKYYKITEKEFNFNSEVRNIYVDYEVISKILYLLYNNDKPIKSTDSYFTCHVSISSIIKRIIKTGNEWIFYNIDSLNIINNLLNDALFISTPDFKDLVLMLRSIIQSFFIKVKDNRLLLIECLFRLNNEIEKDYVMNGYKDMMIDNENSIGNYGHDYNENDEDEEENLYNGKIEFIKGEDYIKEEQEKKMKRLQKKYVSLKDNDWTYDEDNRLNEIYNNQYSYSKSKIEDILLLEFKTKEMSTIHDRISRLKLSDGYDKSRMMIEKIYNPSLVLEKKEKKEKKELQEKLTNAINILSERCISNEEYRFCLFTCIDSIINSLKSYLTNLYFVDGNITLANEYCFIITSKEEVEALEESAFQGFLSNIGFMEVREYMKDDDKDENDESPLIKWRLSPSIQSQEDVEVLKMKMEKIKIVLIENQDLINQKNKLSHEKNQHLNKVIERIRKKDKGKDKERSKSRNKRRRFKEKYENKEEVEGKSNDEKEEYPIVGLNSLKDKEDIYENIDKLIYLDYEDEDENRKSKKRLKKVNKIKKDDETFSDI